MIDIKKYRTNILFYILVLVLGYVLKRHYQYATTSDLLWILTPLTNMVSLFTSIPFEFSETNGYIALDRNIEIGKSCAGINFLIIVLVAGIFAFIDKVKGFFPKIGFFVFVCLSAYLLSLFTNAFRIITDVFLLNFSDTFPFFQTEFFHLTSGVVFFVSSLVAFWWLTNLTLKSAINKTNKG